MKQGFWIGPLSLLLAVLTQLTLQPGGLEALRFRLSGGEPYRPALEATILQFNRNYATFFDTGGLTIGLSEFPATDLVKRRIFHDINIWRAAGLWLIHDKQALEITEAVALSPERAIVDTREFWQIWPKNAETGTKGRGSKSAKIKTRYFLYRDEGTWKVWDYIVYDESDVMPPVERERL